MGFLAAILWLVFVICGGWDHVGLPHLGFWDTVLVSSLGVALIGTVED